MRKESDAFFADFEGEQRSTEQLGFKGGRRVVENVLKTMLHLGLERVQFFDYMPK